MSGRVNIAITSAEIHGKTIELAEPIQLEVEFYQNGNGVPELVVTSRDMTQLSYCGGCEDVHERLNENLEMLYDTYATASDDTLWPGAIKLKNQLRALFGLAP